MILIGTSLLRLLPVSFPVSLPEWVKNFGNVLDRPRQAPVSQPFNFQAQWLDKYF